MHTSANYYYYDCYAYYHDYDSYLLLAKTTSSDQPGSKHKQSVVDYDYYSYEL